MKIIHTAIAALALTACNNSDSDDSADLSPDSAAKLRVCTFVESSPTLDVLQQKVAVNVSTTPVAIDSFSQSLSNFQGDDEELDSAKFHAGLTMSSIALGGAFTSLISVYQCTQQIYDSNACNYTLPGSDSDIVRITTEVDSEGAYTAVVTQGPSEETALTPVVTIVGTIGDAGNLTISSPGEGAFEMVFSRSNSGDESISYTSSATQWTLKEDADCNGSVDYQSLSTENTTLLEASWSYNESATSGGGTIETPNLNGSQEFSW